MVSWPNTWSTRSALSFVKLVALGIVFFMLPVYGIGLGIGMPASKIDFVGITDDWFDLKGTQTAPPIESKPMLWAAAALSVIADLGFIFASDSVKHRTAQQVCRTLDVVGGILVAVAGELMLEHVESNTSDEVGASQTAAFGSLVPVMMILFAVPISYEAIKVLDKKTPDGD